MIAATFYRHHYTKGRTDPFSRNAIDNINCLTRPFFNDLAIEEPSISESSSEKHEEKIS